MSTTLIETAYIQKKDGEFINETAYSFWYGCRMLGVHTVPFTVDELDNLELRKDTLVHGWIGCVRKAFNRLEVEEPHYDGAPPEEIYSFYGRHMWTTTMGEIRKRMASDNHLFIKPLNKQKAFTGHLTSGKISDLIQTASFSDEFEILASDPVEFVSEYRFFVHRGLITGCRHYRGDFTKLIDFDVVQSCVNAFNNAPIGYSLDMGVTLDGRTLVVEINDAFALGAYGQPSIPYAQMVIDRWCEIVELT